jgi:hypothetical protein
MSWSPRRPRPRGTSGSPGAPTPAERDSLIDAGRFSECPSRSKPARELRRLTDAGVELIVQTAWGSTLEEIPPDLRDRQAIYQGHIIVRTDGASFVIETTRGFDAQ